MLTLAPPPRLSREEAGPSFPEFASGGGAAAPPELALADSGARAAIRAASPPTDSAQELAHDARNFLSAVDLYCELLEAPGVLAPRFRHYASDLRQLGRTGGRLLERLAGGQAPRSSGTAWPESAPGASREDVYEAAREAVLEAASDLAPEEHTFPPTHPFPMIGDLAEELLALETPLRALAGPDVRLEVECAPCAGQLGLNSEALLRILFNLVANSVEAMREGTVPGRRKFIRVSARRGGGASFLEPANPGSEGAMTARSAPTVLLSVRDNGPGIAPSDLPRVFDAGFSTRRGRPSGRGLAIVRRLVESAGGTIRAVSSLGFGARFDIELPLAAASIRPTGARASDGIGTARKPGSARNSRILSTTEESGV